MTELPPTYSDATTPYPPVMNPTAPLADNAPYPPGAGGYPPQTGTPYPPQQQDPYPPAQPQQAYPPAQPQQAYPPVQPQQIYPPEKQQPYPTQQQQPYPTQKQQPYPTQQQQPYPTQQQQPYPTQQNPPPTRITANVTVSATNNQFVYGRIANYIVGVIIFSAFSIFCCFALGIAALIVAILAYLAFDSKDYARSYVMGRIAFGLALSAFITGVIFYIIGFSTAFRR